MKHLLSLCSVLLLSASLSAEVLFTDNFSALVGKTLEGYNEWYTPFNGVSSVEITNGLSFSEYAMSDIDNAVLLNGKSGQYQPHHSFAPQSQGSLYVAFMLQPTIVAKSGWFLCLRDAYSTSTYNYVARIHLSDQGYLGLRFYSTAEAVYDDTMPLDGQKTYLVVLKYTVVEGDNNDVISLYVFDSMPSEEPATPLIGPLTDSQAPDICPQNIVLRAYDANSWIVLDGIRVATTWQEAAASLTSALTPTQTAETTNQQCYNILGQLVSTSYHGVIIQRGSKCRKMCIVSF